MCEVIEMQIGDNIIHVADVKKEYMKNIADAARDCDYIDRVILFGSSTRDSCREESDIDLAVFGSQSKSKALTSVKYRRFLDQIYSFDDYNQSYDILYFKTGSRQTASIMNDINRGELLYDR